MLVRYYTDCPKGGSHEFNDRMTSFCDKCGTYKSSYKIICYRSPTSAEKEQMAKEWMKFHRSAAKTYLAELFEEENVMINPKALEAK